MRRTILLVAALMLASACAQGGGEPVGGTIEVTGTEYAFEGIPALVAPGAEFTFTVPEGATEVHEMVIVQIVDGETRTVEEISELPEEESDALVAQFMGILIDTPSGDTVNPEGENTGHGPWSSCRRLLRAARA